MIENLGCITIFTNMAQYNLGKILPVFRGNYKSGWSYEILDVVYHEPTNSTYVCIAPSVGLEPHNNKSNWQILIKGSDTSHLDRIKAELKSELKREILNELNNR